MPRYPFLLTIPHGGTEIPEEVSGLLALSREDIEFYSDPATGAVFCFNDRVEHVVSTAISRIVVDLNRPPYHLPPRYPDGVVKTRTIDGRTIYSSDPALPLVHRLLMAHYFPFHAEIDRLLDPGRIGLAVDCHSMLPTGPVTHPDAGRPRPLVCLSNSGDSSGRARPGILPTCPAAMIMALAGSFREAFGKDADIRVNDPFRGGFIANAHYWHKGIPWVQVEVNRSLYETGSGPADSRVDAGRASEVGTVVWEALARFWDDHSNES